MDWQNFASIMATELQADRSFQQRINLAHGPVENLRNAMLYFMGTDASLRTRSELAKLRECLLIVQTMLHHAVDGDSFLLAPLMIEEIQAAYDFMIRERAFDHVKVWTTLKHQLLCFISSSLAASGA